jgi:phosphoglycerol transferase MdoB-like AlkP superfamily enzyme
MLLFVGLSFLMRTFLLIEVFSKAAFTFGDILSIYWKGLIFDFGISVFFVTPYSIYLLFLPEKWNRSLVNKIFTICIFTLCVFICVFSFFAEFTFWSEFESRFNFIAVDYLIYTYEVVQNINESYPLPLLIGGVLGTTLLLVLLVFKCKMFAVSFRVITSVKKRLIVTIGMLFIATIYISFIPNQWAETGNNRYRQELSKAGIYSFVAAYRNNELSYKDFYINHPANEVLAVLRKELESDNSRYLANGGSIERYINNGGIDEKPNVIMITMESMSAEFMEHFGNKNNITPVMDSLVDSSLLFTNMYATGTRTVRGMEALSLGLPPTPGNSIVRRKDNENLFTVGAVFNSKGYHSTFFYGGDGYFDNMNRYFSHNGFDIVDRGRKIMPDDEIITKRTFIPDSAIHFESAWGICDEDLFDEVIRQADKDYITHTPFYHFVMTTSNHRPYTYPAGKIDIPSGSGRSGAVKYTDYAIGRFLDAAKKHPWFKNTLFIFVADHCASSAGREELTVNNYHIPAFIYNLKNNAAKTIAPMCSQIDLYPTLFHMLGWNYKSKFFGQDVLSTAYHPRTFISTYQILGLLEQHTLITLSPLRKVNFYKLDMNTGKQRPIPIDQDKLNKAVAYYQGAYQLFKNGAMKKE